MSKKILMKGTVAIGEAAIRAGCRNYFGYPITPQSELLEYMAEQLPKRGGVFVQSESELAGISMVHGAAATGQRSMTSSSSPGISLMQEEISTIASAELPVVIVNVSRGSPGLGRITPAQSDYFQACKGGGQGDYKLIVLTPASVQEMAELTSLAFHLADKYMTPAMILGDAFAGQMMESIDESSLDPKYEEPEKPWAVTGNNGTRHMVLTAPFTDPELIELNERLQAKYRLIAQNETRWEEYKVEDAKLIITAFGTPSRFAKAAINALREEGYNVGLIRPITVSPFPYDVINYYADKADAFLDIEMNEGQMLEDVRLAVNGKKPVFFLGGGGGRLTPPDIIVEHIKEIYGGLK